MNVIVQGGLVDIHRDGDLKLRQAARDFESILIASWLDKAYANTGLGGEQAMPGAETLSSFAHQGVAKAIADRGGFGIADLLFAKLANSKRESAKLLPKTADYQSADPDIARHSS